MAAPAAVPDRAYADYAREAERVMGHDYATQFMTHALRAALKKESVVIDMSKRRVGVTSSLAFFVRQWLTDFPDARVLACTSGKRAAETFESEVNNPERLVVLPAGKKRISWRTIGPFDMVVVDDYQFASQDFNDFVLDYLLSLPDLPVILIRQTDMESNYYRTVHAAIKNRVSINPVAAAAAN